MKDDGPSPPATAQSPARRRVALVTALAGAGSLTSLPLQARATADIALPAALPSGGMPLAAALARRRSMREFGPQTLSLPETAQLLWATQGTSAADGRRTAPSAGALYPLEVHLVANRVDRLAPGAYRYRSAAHVLQATVPQLRPAALQSAAHGQAAVGAAAAVVVIAAVAQRSASKYGSRAARYVAFEAGAAAQNLALQAVALGLGAVVIGAFDDKALAQLLQLPAGEQPLALLPLGGV
jgi:SagB-type dehydrogenase family enzyme